MSLPLEGIRILDLTRLLPGPLCSLMLADLGAEIIKVEAPNGGDYTRWFPPMRGEMSGAFAALNRNKRSIALDLKTGEGAAALRRMVPQVDVLLESFRPGVMERLGLDYETLAGLHPGLVYCAITGYGQDGPMAKKAGHDINYLARTGLLSLLGKAGGPPQKCGVQIADIAGGSWSGLSHILAALFRRERTGEGCFCDVSMCEGVLPFLTMTLGEWSAGGEMPTRGRGMLRSNPPCYTVYPCGDGRYLSVGALEPKFWINFLAVLELPHLVSEGFESGESGQKVRAEIEAALAAKPLEEWVEIFAMHDACVEPVWSVEEAMNDPHAQARSYFQTQEHPSEGTLQLPASPFHFQGVQAPDAAPAPTLGQQSKEILQEFGFSPEEIATLVRQK